MTTWFTSDLHIGHRLVSGLRGFHLENGDPDTGAHDHALATVWDNTVHENDTVWVLGDLSINSGPQVAEWFAWRPGHVHLVSGNHDKSHSLAGHNRSAAKRQEWAPLFKSIQDEAEIEIEGRKVTLSHFPYLSWGDGPGRGPARYEKWRPWEGEDTILLHGHTHGTEQVHGRSMHVGLDAHGLQLVPLKEVETWVQSLA